MDSIHHENEIMPIGPVDLRRQLRIDAVLRRTAIATIAAIVVAFTMLPVQRSEFITLLLMLLCGGLWIAMSLTTARTARQLARIHELAGRDPREAETLLLGLMRRYPLHRSVRLLLYYRFSVLQHRQLQFHASSPLCHAILAQRHGVLREVRIHLLLMLVEAYLYHGNTWGAYQGLAALNRMKLNLGESLERFVLQVNYEIAISRDDLPIGSIGMTLDMVELLPPPLCGALHVTLWGAAVRCKHTALADWLLTRARLLCSEDQIQKIAQGYWMPKVAERPT